MSVLIQSGVRSVLCGLGMAAMALVSVGCVDDSSTTTNSVVESSEAVLFDEAPVDQSALEAAGYVLHAMGLETASGRHDLRVAVADERDERVAGLQVVDYLEEGQGMWFQWPDESPRDFWMKDMSIYLDILFVDKDGVIVSIYEDVPPCSSYDVEQLDCEIYSSMQSIQYVLELPSGSAKRYSVDLNDKVLAPTDVVL